MIAKSCYNKYLCKYRKGTVLDQISELVRPYHQVETNTGQLLNTSDGNQRDNILCSISDL